LGFFWDPTISRSPFRLLSFACPFFFFARDYACLPSLSYITCPLCSPSLPPVNIRAGYLLGSDFSSPQKHKPLLLRANFPVFRDVNYVPNFPLFPKQAVPDGVLPFLFFARLKDLSVRQTYLRVRSGPLLLLPPSAPRARVKASPVAPTLWILGIRTFFPRIVPPQQRFPLVLLFRSRDC